MSDAQAAHTYPHCTDCDSCGSITMVRESEGGTICESCDADNDANPQSEPWVVRVCENPCPADWPGQWFEFRRRSGGEWGSVHESRLYLYLKESTR